jgi:hypothetical protein
LGRGRHKSNQTSDLSHSFGRCVDRIVNLLLYISTIPEKFIFYFLVIFSDIFSEQWRSWEGAGVKSNQTSDLSHGFGWWVGRIVNSLLYISAVPEKFFLNFLVIFSDFFSTFRKITIFLFRPPAWRVTRGEIVRVQTPCVTCDWTINRNTTVYTWLYTNEWMQVFVEASACGAKSELDW